MRLLFNNFVAAEFPKTPSPKPARIPPQTPPAGGKSVETGRILSPRQIVSPCRVRISSFNHLDFARNSFELCPTNTAKFYIQRNNSYMDNLKVIVSKNRFGKCLIASAGIYKDEAIAEFDGKIFTAKKCSDLPQDIADHAIQFAEHQWKASKGIACYINHSCDPNCGIKIFSHLP